ncbi:MAG: hypothetical protein P8018_10905 [Acidobacteriota bacterium]|jgi:hypothetical protein
MKRWMIVLALLAFIIPATAWQAQGTWGVEVGAWFAQPRNMQTAYALDFNPGAMGQYDVKPYYTGFDRRWSPMLKVSYRDGSWKTWLSYFRYDKELNFAAASSLGLLVPTYESLYYLGPFAEIATARNRLVDTTFDLNIGRFFHPAKRWKMLAYTGIKHMDLTYDLDLNYMNAAPAINADSAGGGFTPMQLTGYQDVVALQTRTKGWGLNFGLVNTFTANNWLDFVAGFEISMLTTSQDATRLETMLAPDGSLMASVNSPSSLNLITPAYKIFLEGKFKFAAGWYGKIGWRYEAIKDAFKNSAQPQTLGLFYLPGINQSLPRATDLAFDGFYAKVGFTW